LHIAIVRWSRGAATENSGVAAARSMQERSDCIELPAMRTYLELNILILGYIDTVQKSVSVKKEIKKPPIIY